MKELKVQPIKNGTVIDHITPGKALKVLDILNLREENCFTISLLMNVESKTYGKKDIVKIENRELKPSEVDKIALIAQDATINIIRDSNVIKKYTVKLPEKIKNIVRCGNPNCITNLKTEPVEYCFDVVSEKPVTLKCSYCDRETKDISSNII